MKQAKYSLNLFTIVLFVILNIASSVTLASEDTQKPVQPTVGQRKYSPMSAEEARQLVEKIIKGVPPPLSGGSTPHRITCYGKGPAIWSSWELPENLVAQGIKINDNDYVVFAHTEPIAVLLLIKENLSEFLPKIEKTPLETKMVGTAEVPFFLNGIIFSTVDLEVVNNPIFTYSRSNLRLWNRAKQVIEKGGYIWYIGAMGILLPSYDNKTLMISFEEALTDFLFNPPDVYMVYPVALSISPGEHAGILLEVAGQVIQLK